MNGAWVTTTGATYTVMSSLSCAAIDASNALGEAMHDGTLRSRLPDGSSLDPAKWYQCDGGIGHADFREAEVCRADLTRWLKACEPRVSNAGRRPLYEWEACLAAMIPIFAHAGLPSTQAELVEKMKQWFIDQIDDHPSDTELKKRARLIQNAWRDYFDQNGGN